jgi:hypothetical protein
MHAAGAENLVKMGHGDAADRASAHEGSGSSKASSKDAVDAHATIDEGSLTYCCGALTITISCICEMADKGYFVKGDDRTPGEETTPKPSDFEALVFEDFFIAGLHMPLHPALADALLKF